MDAVRSGALADGGFRLLCWFLMRITLWFWGDQTELEGLQLLSSFFIWQERKKIMKTGARHHNSAPTGCSRHRTLQDTSMNTSSCLHWPSALIIIGKIKCKTQNTQLVTENQGKVEEFQIFYQICCCSIWSVRDWWNTWLTRRWSILAKCLITGWKRPNYRQDGCESAKSQPNRSWLNRLLRRNLQIFMKRNTEICLKLNNSFISRSQYKSPIFIYEISRF